MVWFKGDKNHNIWAAALFFHQTFPVVIKLWKRIIKKKKATSFVAPDILCGLSGWLSIFNEKFPFKHKIKIIVIYISLGPNMAGLQRCLDEFSMQITSPSEAADVCAVMRFAAIINGYFYCCCLGFLGRRRKRSDDDHYAAAEPFKYDEPARDDITWADRSSRRTVFIFSYTWCSRFFIFYFKSCFQWPPTATVMERIAAGAAHPLEVSRSAPRGRKRSRPVAE